MSTLSKPLPENMIWSLLGQMISVLNFLHDNKKPIIHRDISPDNIIITEFDEKNENIQVVLADYDTIREIDETRYHTRVGKPGYWAPEVNRGEAYGTRADIWSLGVVLCRIMTLTRNSETEVAKITSNESEIIFHEKMRTIMMVS
jgi:serine/threonine protein kinase